MSMRGVSRWTQSLVSLAWSVALAVMLTACQTPKAPPPPEAKPTTPTGPSVSAVKVPPMDLASVKGRVIALDPGHGGPWPGAVANSNGLREADLNLKVALTVRALLTQAGATVVMTRENDAVPVPGSMTDDLAARPALAQKAGAEIYVSVHHNSAGDPASQCDDMEVYYKFRDDGPSLALGETLTRELARRARRDASPKSLMPGNYKVLREAPMPAVLLESFYLSDPKSAVFLATDDGVRAEAEAIAAGIAQFFAMDPPRATAIAPRLSPDGRSASIDVAYAGATPVDLASLRATANGQSLKGCAAGKLGQLTWTFAQSLPNGDLRGVLSGWNEKGAPVQWPFSVSVHREPALLQATVIAAMRPGAEVCVEARALDAAGLPVADGTAIAATPGGLSTQTVDGVARFYLDANAGTLNLSAGAVKTSIQLARGDANAARSIRVTRAADGGPVAGVWVIADGQPAAATTLEGWAAIPGEATSATLQCPGYAEQTVRLSSARATAKLSPADGDALLGRRIAIDANFGGRTFGAVGPTGLRACDVNLKVAKRLAERLRAAGAVVTALRDGDEDLSDLQRVAEAEDARAELYLGVSYGATNASRDERAAGGFVRHYWNSEKGKRLAELIAQQFGGLSTGASSLYPISQTSGVAVIIQPANVGSSGEEDHMRDFANIQRAAEAIYQGVRAYFEGDAAAKSGAKRSAGAKEKRP